MRFRHPLALILLIVASLGLGRAGDAAERSTKPKLVHGGGQNTSGVFHAGADGATWSLPKGGRIMAAAGAELRVFGKPQALVLEPPKRTPTYTVMLLSGVVHADVGEGKSAVLVSASGKLNAIVKRGSMAFAAGGGHSAVASLGGDVLTATTRGAYRKLASSQALELSPEQGATTRGLLAAPQVALPNQVLMAHDGSASLGALSWQSVPGASRYLVEVRGHGLEHPLRRSSTQTQLTAPLGPLTPGHYEVHVRAVEQSGLPGHAATPTRVTVVGAQLPDGGYRDDQGAIRVGAGQTVLFAPVDGLDVATGRDGRFLRSQGAVTLRDDRGTSVFFKLPGTVSVARADIAPRGVRARVDFAPKNPEWPRHTVRARVRLRAQDARALAGITPTFRVMLGVEVIEADVQAHGDSYILSVKPHSGPGPWVLRVEVRDQWDVELGRSSVEIVREEKPRRKPRAKRR